QSDTPVSPALGKGGIRNRQRQPCRVRIVNRICPERARCPDAPLIDAVKVGERPLGLLELQVRCAPFEQDLVCAGMAGKYLIDADDRLLETAGLIKFETLDAGLVVASTPSFRGCDDRARDRQHNPCNPHGSSSPCAPRSSNLIVVAVRSPRSVCEPRP